MNAFEMPIALLAFLAIIAVVPAWIHFQGEHLTDLPIEAQFLGALVLPATILLFLASWIQPG